MAVDESAGGLAPGGLEDGMSRSTLRDVRRRHYFTIDNRVIDVFGEALGSSAMAVYMSLVRHGNATGEATIRVERIGKDVGLGKTAVREALKKLEGADLIAVNHVMTPNGQASSQYLLVEVPYDLREDWNTRQPERITIKTYGPPESGALQIVQDQRSQNDNMSTSEPTGIRGAGPPESEVPGHRIPVGGAPESGGSPIEEKTLVEKEREDAPIIEFDSSELGGVRTPIAWSKVKVSLGTSGKIRPAEIESWFRDSKLVGRRGSTVVIEVGNAHASRRLEERYQSAVRDGLLEELGIVCDAVAFVVAVKS